MHAIILGLLFACNSQESANSNKEAKKDEGSFGQLNVEDLKKAAKEVDLVPSPLKMKEEFKKKGLKANLSTYVLKKDFKMDITDKDQLALRAGVLLCDLVLTVETAPAADSIQNLEALKIGFNGLGAGGDIAATIDELIDTLKGENPNKGALLSDMDDLSQVMVPELKYEAGEWVVPLIQAGSWLEGANLVSAAIKKENNVEAEVLLRQPGAAAYFGRYVNREGRSKAPPAVINKLSDTLKSLESLAKKDKLEMTDVIEINRLTSELMTML